MSRCEGPWLAGVVLVHALLVIHRLDVQSLWLDEVMSLEAVRGSMANLWAFLRYMPEQHPLYYLLLRGWLVFGESEWALRAFSGLWSLASIAALYFLARRVFGIRVACVASLLLALSPFQVYYAQEARMYTLLGFLAILNTHVLLLWLETPTRARAAAYVAAAVLGMYTHFFFLLLIFVQGAAVALQPPRSRELIRRLLLLYVAALTVYLPQGLMVIRNVQGEGQSWKGVSHILFGIPYTLLRFAMGYGVIPPNFGWKERVLDLAQNAWWLLLPASLVIGLLVLVGIRALAKRDIAGRLVLASFAGPMIAATMVSVLFILIGERYFMVSFPFFILVLAVGVTDAQPLIKGAALTWSWRLSAVLLTMVLALGAQYDGNRLGKDQWRQAAAAVARQIKAGDVVVVSPSFAKASFQYYFGMQRREVYEAREMPPDSMSQRNRVWIVSAVGHGGASEITRHTQSLAATSKRTFETFFPLGTGINVTLWEPRTQ